jgi:hypothetical protein
MTILRRLLNPAANVQKPHSRIEAQLIFNLMDRLPSDTDLQGFDVPLRENGCYVKLDFGSILGSKGSTNQRHLPSATGLQVPQSYQGATNRTEDLNFAYNASSSCRQ